MFENKNTGGEKMSKEFWKWNGEELCNSQGVLTLAEQFSGKRPSRTTLRKWLSNGLMYKAFVSRSYVFRVETVKKFLESLDKTQDQRTYKQEAV